MKVNEEGAKFSYFGILYTIGDNMITWTSVENKTNQFTSLILLHLQINSYQCLLSEISYLHFLFTFECLTIILKRSLISLYTQAHSPQEKLREWIILHIGFYRVHLFIVHIYVSYKINETISAFQPFNNV